MPTDRAPRDAHPAAGGRVPRSTAPSGGHDDLTGVLDLQQVAGNRAVAGVLARGLGAPPGGPHDPQEHDADRVALSLDDPATLPPLLPGSSPAAASPAGAGRPLPDEVRERLEAHLGRDLGTVRLHTGPRAQALADEHDARAVTVGPHVHWGAGEPGPETAAGMRLMAHEVAHTLEPGPPRVRAKGRGKKPIRHVTKITIFVDRGIAVLEIDGGATVTLPLTYNGRPPPGRHTVTRGVSSPAIAGVANAKGYVAEWVDPPDATYLKADPHTVTVVPGRPGPSGSGTGGDGGGGDAGTRGGGTGGGGTGDTDAGGSGGPGSGTGAGKADGGPGGATGGTTGGGQAGVAGATGAGPTGGATDAGAPRLTAEEEAVWRKIAELMKGGGTSTESPAELVRLFQVLRSVVVDPTFGTEGESWVRFARFIDRNRDKIEGLLRSGPKGTITSAALEQILVEYGRFVATTPDPEHPGQLETADDFDREFRYDPGWARLSQADRRLLVEYARATPDELGDKKVDFVRLTTSAKMIMALKVADTSVLGAVGDAAKAAFSDPKFWVTLVTIMSIYVGLWLTPDPSWVTKLLAGGLTVYLWTQFAIDDIYGFAVAWSDLSDACARGTTLAELKAAGDAFLTRVGPIGFDIMMLIVMWRVGKLAGPKLQRIGAKRAVARAEARVAAAEAAAGSGVPKPRGGAPDPLAAARTSAGGTSPAQVLDALAPRLPEAARQGLATMRSGKAGDAGTLRALEQQSAAGNDLARFLTEKTVPKEAATAAQAALTRARLDLARAKLIQTETIKDPQLRETIRQEQYRTIREVLEDAGSLKAEGVRKAIAARDVGALKKALKAEIDGIGRRTSAHETKGAIGEALQRAELRARYAGKKGVTFLSNLALVRRLGSYRSLAEWRSAAETRLRGAQQDITDKALRKALSKEAAKLFEKDGRVFESLGEIDTMVVEPGTGGRVRPLEFTEVKTGSETPGQAKGQLDKAAAALERINGGDPDVRVFEMRGKKELGSDITGTLDLSDTAGVPRTTYGPVGEKAFDKSLGYTVEDLAGVAETILRNTPPEKPARPAPVSYPKDRDEEPAPAR